MNTNTQKLGTLIAAGFLMSMAGLAQASLLDVTFGSANDGYAGFTSGLFGGGTPVPVWSNETNGVRFTNAPTNDSGQVNSSLLREITLDRTSGRSYTITGVADLINTYANDNNRLGISLFTTSDDVAGALTGLSLQINLGNSLLGIRRPGVDGGTNTSAALSGVTATQLIGQTLTYTADILFTGLNIEIDFTLSAPINSYSQTVSAIVLAADYTGDNFGFGARGRVRNTDTRIDPFIYEAKSFSVIPEPSTLALLGIALGSLVLFRPRK